LGGDGNRQCLANVQLAITIVEREGDLLGCGGRCARWRKERSEKRGNKEEWSERACAGLHGCSVAPRDTLPLMPAAPIRYLTEADVLALLPAIQVQIGLVEGALRAVATGTAHQPPKVPLHLGAGAPFAHAMPAAIDLGSGRVAGAKWISGGGAAGIGGVVLVERPKAGGLRGVVAAGELTAARTAAVSGAGLRIAPPSTAAAASGAPYKGAIIGGGLQAATHRAVLAALHPAITVAFFSRRAASELPLRAGDRVAESVNDAIRGADIIVTAAAFDTPPRPIDVKLIEPGATILVIDYAATISAGVIAALSDRGPIRVITDSAAQYDDTRRTPKLSGWPAADAQIGDTRIESAGRVTTLVNHLGISACDLAYAELLLDLAEKQNVGTLLAR
jgi:ornithine cyclodeaminase/alanine dehydrogenase-like protein (mu-crystallin family)